MSASSSVLGCLRGEVAVDHLADAVLPKIGLVVAAGRSGQGRAGPCRRCGVSQGLPPIRSMRRSMVRPWRAKMGSACLT